MEVFLGNVPIELTDQTLARELKPYMNALGIVDWRCSSIRDKKVGFITFLRYDDGSKFLRRHGKESPLVIAENASQGSERPARRSDLNDKSVRGSRPPRARREKPRLFLPSTNIPVFASESSSPPDSFMLKTLRLQREELPLVGPSRDESHDALAFHVHRLDCGHLAVSDQDDNMKFVRQCSLHQRGSVKFANRMLIVRFDAAGTTLRIPYDTILNMITNSSRDWAVFTLVLNEAPRIYAGQSLEEKMAAASVSGPNSSKQKPIERATHLPGCSEHSKYVSYCLVYQLDVRADDVHSRLMKLKKRNLVIMSHNPLTFIGCPAPLTEDFTTANYVFQENLSDCAQKKALPFRILFQAQSLVWNTYLHPYAANELLLYIKEAFKQARARSNPDPVSVEAMKNWSGTIPFPYPGMHPKEVGARELMGRLLRSEQRVREATALSSDDTLTPAPNQVWIFKATVTPTRITLHGPELEPMNRILRKFPKHNDHFMRVQFCDESGDDLFMSPKVSHEQVFDRYRKVLSGGIPIAGRIYGFLGFSHSSLRSHSAWFSAPFFHQGQLQTYNIIIQGLGDFDRIQIPAKCAARIGQAFSETPSYVSLTECNIVYRSIPDVKSADGTRVFSDGVGTISRDALQAIWPQLPQRGDNALPTCLQIRWAGVKGMLCLDSTIPGRIMNVRDESMLKFPSEDKTNLEICGTASKPLRLVLNRQLIKILEDMMVDQKWFLSLQKRELDRLRAVTADAYNTSTFLQLQGIGTNFYLSTFIKTLDKYDIDYRNDDFLRTVVEAVVLRELRLLKHKARISVSKGVTLFGVMDETGFLREGEVYVCYDSVRRPGKVPIENTLTDGWVLVTRSPALHPGDIQLVRMRTPPAGHSLRKLRNCIVFNKRGERDLPSQLSGGDLDGDLYNIIWDEEALPKTSFPPADYPRVTPKGLGRRVEREDMANWFVDFMQSDILGMIATRHLVMSDKMDEGTCDENCLELAAMHSTAVDFSKSGIAVKIADMPKTNGCRPDFLAPAPPANLLDRHEIEFLGRTAPVNQAYDENEEDAFQPNHRYYKSEKILGLLYRNVDEKRIWDDDIHRVVNQPGPSVWAQFAGLMENKVNQYAQGGLQWKSKKAKAKNLRAVYEEGVLAAMNQYSDNNMRELREVEVFCGFIFNRSGSQTRRQKDNSTKLQEEFERVSDVLVANMRRRVTMAGINIRDDVQFVASVDDYPPSSGPKPKTKTSLPVNDPVSRALAPNKDALELSYACFREGLGANEDADFEQRTPLVSFKIIAASVLLKELTEFTNRLHDGKIAQGLSDGQTVTTGGGFVGVSSGGAQFPQYGANPWDIGQLPNWGFSKYL